MFFFNCLYYSTENFPLILVHIHACFLQSFRSQMNFMDLVINLFSSLCFVSLHLRNLIRGYSLENNDLVNLFDKLNFINLMACLLYLLQNLNRLYSMHQLLYLNYHDLLQDFKKQLLGQACELDSNLGNKTHPHYFRLQFPQ